MCQYLCITFLLLLLQCSMDAMKLDLKDYMLAGAIATATTDLLLYPIDTVKVTQQSTKQNLPLKQTIESIYKSAGNNVGRFFKGAAGYAALDGFSAAIFFAVYEEMKFLAAKSLSGAALGLSAYPSAAIAFSASTIFLVPAEYVKTRMQTSDKYETSLDCIEESLDLDGWRGLYSGYAAIWARDLPYFTLQLGCYDNIKNILGKAFAASVAARLGQRLNVNNIELISSLAAGVITGFLTNPLDIMTTRLITQDTEKEKEKRLFSWGNNDKDRPYEGLVDCATRMYKEEGLKVFFVGSVARVAWIAPFTAISLGLNEQLKRQIFKWKSLDKAAAGLGGSALMKMMRKFPPRSNRM